MLFAELFQDIDLLFRFNTTPGVLDRNLYVLMFDVMEESYIDVPLGSKLYRIRQ